MKIYLFFSVFLLLTTQTNAQTPKIAVVKPDGITTSIFNDLPSAYTFATDGDVIYLPGGTFNLTGDSIAKRISLIGAGITTDSSNVTGITKIISGFFRLKNTASGSSFEGIEFLIGNDLDLGNASNVEIKNCKTSIIKFANNSIIKNCILSGWVESFNNSIISNCFFDNGNVYGGLGTGSIKNCLNSTIQNCIFETPGACCPSYISNCTNCIVKNNIFPSNGMGGGSTNTFFNNIQYTGYAPQPNEVNTIIVNSVSDIFTTPMTTIFFNETFNFELSATCTGNNAGTDGTDVGIYGTSFPCSKGWVPSNPHIYYKNVGLQTTPDGKLQINYKVRSGN
jgi:hypothetical protein